MTALALAADTTPPVVSNVLPSGTISTTSTTISASYSDRESGISVTSVAVYLDGSRVMTCSATAASVSCPVTGLTSGTHVISGSVANKAGLTSPISGSFTVALSGGSGPVVTNVLPTGTISGTSATISASYSDATYGIDVASVAVYLDGARLTACTATTSNVSCPVSGLSTGTHAISGSVANKAGVSSPISGSFAVGSGGGGGPVVTNVLPTGTIGGTSATISASYSDSTYGIDASSVAVYLDGARLTTCTATSSSVYCPVTGLYLGSHVINGSVSNKAGMSSPINGSFIVGTGGGSGPVVTNVLPTGTISSTSTTVSASYSDATYGIDTASVAVYLDGVRLTSCTATASNVNCPVFGLANGSHLIGGSVANNGGIASFISGSFVVSATDTTPPTIGGLQPSGWINSSSASISAYFNDAGSGINSSSAVVYLDGAKLAGCTATAGGINCPVSGLSVGPHGYTVSVADMAGNNSSASANFSVDVVPPAVSGVEPAGIIDTGNATVSVYYSDDLSGINNGSVKIYLDGSSLAGCVVTATRATCDVSGLTAGGHVISGSVSDNAGNSTAISGSFSVLGPTVGDVIPAGTIATNSTTISVSFDDPVNGIDGASAKVYLDGVRLTTCTGTTANVNCPVSGLSPGDHDISGSIASKTGVVAMFYGGFTVATQSLTPPVIYNIEPSGTTDDSPVISAAYSDSGSGIDTASVKVYLDGTKLGTCSATMATVSCPVTGLADGGHLIEVSVANKLGVKSSASGSFSVLTVPLSPPTVFDVLPAGTITDTSIIISASYSDSGSGIRAGSVTVSLDGETLTSCSATATGVSCPVSGLAPGSHVIGGSVANKDGLTSPISGSFTIVEN